MTVERLACEAEDEVGINQIKKLVEKFNNDWEAQVKRWKGADARTVFMMIDLLEEESRRWQHTAQRFGSPRAVMFYQHMAMMFEGLAQRVHALAFGLQCVMRPVVEQASASVLIQGSSDDKFEKKGKER